jgi:hypothetical protein
MPDLELAEQLLEFSERIDAELRRIVQRLPEGRIVYRPKQRMRQGIPENISVRIAPESEVDPRTLTAGLARVEELVIEPIRFTGAVTADLTGSPEEFEVEELSSARQALAPPYTEWQWLVTPLRSGSTSLHLSVSAVIRLSNGDKETYDVLLKKTEIIVQVNRPWVVKRWFGAHWKWLAGTPLFLGLTGWIGAWVRKKLKGP